MSTSKKKKLERKTFIALKFLTLKMPNFIATKFEGTHTSKKLR